MNEKVKDYSTIWNGIPLLTPATLALYDHIVYLLNEVKRLREGIETLPKNKIEEAQRIMRENGFVIDDLDDRWQKLCFTFYTDILDMQTKIEELYKLLEEGDPQ